jgi:hypothetical protein
MYHRNLMNIRNIKIQLLERRNNIDLDMFEGLY